MEKEIWETKDGDILFIKDMTTDHLINCVKMMAGYLYLDWYDEYEIEFITSKLNEMKAELNSRFGDVKFDPLIGLYKANR